jgi:glycosyltransferase involved in cell wall biosynthesis
MIDPPLISVVLGSYNRCKLLKLTIKSVRNELKDISHEIIVVDGGSNDGSSQWLTKQKDIITIIQHNRGEWNGKKIKRQSWGYFMNIAFKAAKGKYVCMISDDCLIVPGAILNGYHLFESEQKKQKVGALAFYWRDWPAQTKYRVGLTLGDKMFVNHGLYLRSALEEVNYIDEDTYYFYCGDGDLMLKMWEKGYCCLASSDSYIEHFSHTNTEIRAGNYEKYELDWNSYLARWTGVFYSPEKKNIGGWEEKEHFDEFKTAEQYSIHFRKSIFFRNIRSLKSRVLNRLKR